MSGLRILLLGMFALTLLGQSENNAVPNPGAAINTAVRGIVQRSLTASNLLPPADPVRRPLAPGGATNCAVPLLEMPIPTGRNFVIGQLNPPKTFVDNMVVERGLLPACALRE
jgi:hypothetical protein